MAVESCYGNWGWLRREWSGFGERGGVVDSIIIVIVRFVDPEANTIHSTEWRWVGHQGQSVDIIGK